jgi:ribosomal protein S18 acetylase RimI-like enzyme
MSSALREVAWRSAPGPGDVFAVRRIVESTGFFHAHEVDVAVELVQTRLGQGEASGYHFVFADTVGGDDGAAPVGYACFGEVPCTRGSYDLYWIAVQREGRQRGIGRGLLIEVERRVAALGGRMIWVETSSRELYAPTHAFYEACGYELVARLPAFYEVGDDKLVYARTLPRADGSD